MRPNLPPLEDRSQAYPYLREIVIISGVPWGLLVTDEAAPIPSTFDVDVIVPYFS